MEEGHKPSGSTSKQRPSNPTKTRVGHLILSVLEDLPTCKCGAPTQDGGNSSDTVVDTSQMSRTTRFLMYQATKMLKDKTFMFGRDTVDLTRDGRSSTSTPRQESESRD